MVEPSKPPSEGAPGPDARPRTRGPVWRLVPWIITAACFAYLYYRLEGAAARQGESLLVYLGAVFAKVSWGHWLALMIPYSLFYFLVDSTVVWRVVNWYNARVAFGDVLPVRGSSYILSIVNEQVGKGAMALYLNRRYGVPGWEVGSSMLFIMFCEFFYLLTWATIGYGLEHTSLPPEFRVIPFLATAALVFFVFFVLYFQGRLASGSALRERPFLKAFREARLWHYPAVILIRSPAMLVAVLVYTQALRLFGVEIGMARMLGTLPVIFFGAATPGPMRTVAITLWVILFPGHEGEMTAFGFVQHNFFIFFNAAIGLLFLRRAQREIFEGGTQPA